MQKTDQTCMLTRLPILPGETCVGVLIRRNYETKFDCCPDAFWTPVSAPFEGVYDGVTSMNALASGTCALAAVAAKNLVINDNSEYVPVADGSEAPEEIAATVIRAAVMDELLALRPGTGQEGKSPRYDPVRLIFIRRDAFCRALADTACLPGTPTMDPASARRLDPVLTSALMDKRITAGDLADLVTLDKYMTALCAAWAPTVRPAGSGNRLAYGPVMRFYESLSEMAAYVKSVRTARDMNKGQDT